MAHVKKGRQIAYDNIAVGSAISSRERTISGATGPDNTVIGNGENIADAADYGEERVVKDAALIEIERVGGA